MAETTGLPVETVEIEVVSGDSLGAGHATLAWSKRRGLILRLRSQSLEGLGEASPLPGYSPDTFESVHRALSAWRPGVVEARLEGVRTAVEALPPSLPSARFAAETALLDLLGQVRAEPLHCLLGAPETMTGRSASLLDLGLDESGSRNGSAAALFASGFQDLKIKIGRAGRFDEEVRALAALREDFPGPWRLRLDANGLLKRTSLEQELRALASFSPSFLEEPVPWPELGELAPGPIPLAIDEALRQGWAEVSPWMESGACAVAVLKPLVLGGVLPGLELAHKARRLGVVSVASHGFDGPIALQATSALGLALDSEVLDSEALDSEALQPIAHGTAPHAGLAAWPEVDGLISQGPRLRGQDAGPGLGLQGLGRLERRGSQA